MRTRRWGPARTHLPPGPNRPDAAAADTRQIKRSTVDPGGVHGATRNRSASSIWITALSMACTP